MNDYEEYLERYAKCRHITKEEAEQHLIVRIVKAMYLAEEEIREKITL